MEIKTLSKERGIIALYDGVRYIIYSTTYGVVAESSKIERMGEGIGVEKAVHILFEVCDWYGYWDLKSIMARGIKRVETQFVEKQVDIAFDIKQGEQMHLNRRLVISTEEC